MPRIRYTGTAGYSIRGGPSFEAGDEAEVGEATADRLTDRWDFEAGEAEADQSGESAPEEPDEYPVRVESYTRQGKCGFFDPDEMDDPCARAAGWGRDADDGPCQQHIDELEG